MKAFNTQVPLPHHNQIGIAMKHAVRKKIKVPQLHFGKNIKRLRETAPRQG